MQDKRPPGNIITFYSYKGGTGRTMALANTACVLAERIGPDEKVLVVDWDLEAPGLHQFLPARLRNRSPVLDTGLGAELGLIDLFVALRDALPPTEPASEEEAGAAANAALAQIRIEHFIGDTEVPKIHIVRAGRNDDGDYSKRVNTFDWEALFRRSPGLYRKVAEHLAERYRYVLIDSRTGVTDISGICTSLLPEKLVVVFTPNRQSLTGVRELVGRATAYRLGSDDLRSLLVYPLPSRIEVSLEKLNAQWRHGNPDAGIFGYQPMFQRLLKECYALTDCDMADYFDAVQIQQSADCAYGEVISVRQTSSERLSLASSYRVFADRLLSDQPPWRTKPAVDLDLAMPEPPATLVKPPPVPAPRPAAARASPEARQVFLSYARDDLARVKQVAEALKQRGFAPWMDTGQLEAGVAFQEAITSALDASDVVVVFWSKASSASEWVKAEAGEGARRGVLLPVLLDDAYPPLEFRRYQAADLRQHNADSLDRLVDAVAHLAERRPADPAPTFAPDAISSMPSPRASTAGAAPSRGGPSKPAWLAVGVLVLAIASFAAWRVGMRPGADAPDIVPPAQTASGVGLVTAPRLLAVPDFKGRTTQDVQKVAEVLGLNLVMTDEKHSVEQRYLEGVVVGQAPAAGMQVAPQATVTLTVATQTVRVPSVVGMALGRALDTLTQNGLALGRSDSVAETQAAPGSVVRQSPAAGTAVPAGTKVDVGVAASVKPYSSARPFDSIGK